MKREPFGNGSLKMLRVMPRHFTLEAPELLAAVGDIALLFRLVAARVHLFSKNILLANSIVNSMIRPLSAPKRLQPASPCRNVVIAVRLAIGIKNALDLLADLYLLGMFLTRQRQIILRQVSELLFRLRTHVFLHARHM